MIWTGYRWGMRTVLLLVLLMVFSACIPETGITPDTADYPPLTYSGIGPQTAVCTHHNCCAIIAGEIECVGGDGYGLTSGAPAGSGWVGLESNPRYLCAWDSGGDWSCWGSATNPLIAEVPDILVADIRLGTGGGIALRPNGSIKLWGTDYHGQISEAPSGGKYIAVEAGYGWRCAVEDTGALLCWGIEDGDGIEATEHAQVTDAPTDRGFLGLNRGVGDVLSGVDVEGRVYSWGGGRKFANDLDGVFVERVAPSDNYACGQLPSGVLVCAGALLEPFEVEPADTLAQPIAPVSDVACGHRWCCAVIEDELGCWGEGQAL